MSERSDQGESAACERQGRREARPESLHLIVGAGAVGSGTARRLADDGHDVQVITRSGSGPKHNNIELIAADAADTSTLTTFARGAHSIYNCANPPYNRWPSAWPPLAASFLAAAEATGARLITMSNLYGFAPGVSPMAALDALEPTTKKGAIRANMWHDAAAAHRAGRIRATEARASDFYGPGVGETAHLGDRALATALKGKTVRVMGDPDSTHSWTFIDDVCATLATLGTDDRSLGRAWHVPTATPQSARHMITRFCQLADVATVAVKAIPPIALRLAGLVMPVVRELGELQYQFTERFVIDSADTTAVFGLTAADIDDALNATLRSYGHDNAGSDMVRMT